MEKNLSEIKQSLSGSQQGFSIVEVLIAMGLMGIMVTVMASVFVEQHKQMRGLSQKQEMIELKNMMLLLTNNTSSCTWQLKDRTINVSMATTELSPSPTVVSLPNGSLYLGPSVSSPAIAVAGETLPSSSSGIKVESVSFKGIHATGNPDEYRGFIEVEFDQSTLVRPMAPVRVSQIIRVVSTDPTSAKKILNCLPVGRSTNCVLRFPTVVKNGPCGIVAEAFCLPDEYVVSGGTSFVGNIALQQTGPLMNGGRMIGWRASYLDTGGGALACTINEFSYGTTRPGTNPCYTTSQSTLCGSAKVVCCK